MNHDDHINYCKIYYQKNKDKIKLKRKNYYEKNKIKVIQNVNNYKKSNIKRYNEYRKKLYNKKKLNKLFVLKLSISSRLRASFKRLQINKSNRLWRNILGYTKEDLMKHLESKFTPEMSWDNYGTYWDIDHKTPITFAYNEKDLIYLFQLDNLQPLEKMTNIKKSNKQIADLFNINFKELI